MLAIHIFLKVLTLVTFSMNISLSRWHLETFLTASINQDYRSLASFSIGADANIGSSDLFGQQFDKMAPEAN